MNRISDDVLRLVLAMFVGDDKVDKFVGTLGSVNKQFLRVSRDRQIWESFYHKLFPSAKFVSGAVRHVGDCTYARCGIGYYRYYDGRYSHTPYRLDSNARVMMVRRSWAMVSGATVPVDTYYTPVKAPRCDNPSHYTPGSFVTRRAKSRFKNMFKRSAKRYYTVNKGRYNRCTSAIEMDMRIYEDKIRQLQGYLDRSERFHGSFIDEYKPKAAKR